SRKSVLTVLWITSIAFNPANPQEAWVTIGGANGAPVWHTLNALATSGTTWSALQGSGAGNVPYPPVTAGVEDPKSPNTLYLGLYYGVQVCTSCGGTSPNPNWESLGTGLPNVEVKALTLTADGSTLVAWTYGRGAWSYPLAPSPKVFLPAVL